MTAGDRETIKTAGEFTGLVQILNYLVTQKRQVSFL